MAIPQTLLPRKTREQWDHRYLPRCVLGFRSALGSCQIISVINPGKSSYRDHGMPCRRIFTPSSYFPPILRLPKCNLHVSIIFWKGIVVLTGVVHLSIIKSKARGVRLQFHYRVEAEDFYSTFRNNIVPGNKTASSINHRT